ncbi:TadE-like protein [Monaibacterium marinum]|uniref:TadE-like protein n=2 Tax=Pontivivens marinum TaxID=1690039 RepID=A0A2C9CTM2_9RHOB|nr:TadE-like protein [Monaibacterium marinum]
MMRARIRQMIGRFISNERGAASLEYVIVFTPLMLLILLIVQVSIAYHWALSAQKGLEMAARLAAVTPPVSTSLTVQTGLGTRVINRTPTSGASVGDACYLGACETIATSVCNGSAFALRDDETIPDSDCDFTRFKLIYDEVDRFAYSLELEDFAIAYEDVSLGNAGQTYVPLIVLAVSPQSMPMILRMFDTSVEFEIPEILATIVAEDLSN